MGGSESKSVQITRIINETTTNVMAEMSTSVKSATQQSNDLTIKGIRGSSISNITQQNEAKIDISVVESASISGELQSKLSAALKLELEKKASTIGYSASESLTETDIQNIVNTNITSKTVKDVFSGINQSNKLVIEDVVDSQVEDISQTNIGKAISKLTSEVDAEIQASLGIEADVEIKDTQTSSNPYTDTVNALSAALSGSGGMMILFLVLIALGAFIFKDQLKGLVGGPVVALWNKYYPYDLYALIALVGSIVLYVLLT